MKRNWKRIQPTSLQQAMELSVQHAKEVHCRSVDSIADLMGLANKWAIYKWIESGALPSRSIRAFEHACGCDFITRWLAHSGGKLLITIPTGRNITPTELSEVHQTFAETIGKLSKFYEGKDGAQETLNQVTALMESLAWHHGNVQAHVQPAFDFAGEGK